MKQESKLFFLLIFTYTISLCGYSQQNIDSLYKAGICTSEGFALPQVEGFPPSKGVELFQERAPNYNLKSTFRVGDSTFSNKIRRDKTLFFRLRAPVINKDNFSLLIGLRYLEEQFAFENPGNLDNDFHARLQDKPLRSAGVSVYAVKPFKGSKYLVARSTFRLNGDFIDNREGQGPYARYTLSAIYGFKKSRFKTWGVGLSYNNTFGNSRLVPALFYRQKWNEKWGVNAFLPVSLRILYTLNDKNTFYLENLLEGDNYNLGFDKLPVSTLFLEKSEFKSFVTYEREIYDFLWFSISAGIRANLNFNLNSATSILNTSLPGNTDIEDVYIENSVGTTFFFKYGVFLVPPKKWRDKNKN